MTYRLEAVVSKERPLFTGEGVLTFPNGWRYEGQLDMGRREGQGVLYDEHGLWRYEGQWREDQRHGEGTEYGDDRRLFRGRWQRGELVETLEVFSRPSLFLMIGCPGSEPQQPVERSAVHLTGVGRDVAEVQHVLHDHLRIQQSDHSICAARHLKPTLVRQALKGYLDERPQESKLVIFSCHGDEQGRLLGTGGVVLIDFDGFTKLWRSSKTYKAGRFCMVIVDACHSGVWVDRLRANANGPDLRLAVQASCRASEKAADRESFLRAYMKLVRGPPKWKQALSGDSGLLDRLRASHSKAGQRTQLPVAHIAGNASPPDGQSQVWMFGEVLPLITMAPPPASPSSTISAVWRRFGLYSSGAGRVIGCASFTSVVTTSS